MDGAMTVVNRRCQVDIALRWVKDYATAVATFVNTIPTPHGGTHLAGFDRALTRAVNDSLLADVKKLARLAKQGNDRAQREDVQEGLVAAVKVTLPEPQFRGQTKQELGTPAVQSIVYNVLKDGLESWFQTGPKSHVTGLQSKIADAVINRVSARQTLENKRRAASLGSTGMPDKLADCRVHGPDSELILVEGDSAAGPAKAGRNAENMAILPLRGKVVNAAKSSMKQVLDNAEAQALFTAMGAGSGDDFDMAKARYGRIVILCDADVDGSHIRCLLLTLIHRFMLPMLEAGRVYAAHPRSTPPRWGTKPTGRGPTPSGTTSPPSWPRGTARWRTSGGPGSRGWARWTPTSWPSAPSTPRPGRCVAHPGRRRTGGPDVRDPDGGRREPPQGLPHLPQRAGRP